MATPTTTAAPALAAAPAPSPAMPQGMDGMAQLAGAFPKGDPMQPLAQQEVAQGEQLSRHMDEDEAELSHLDQAQQANWQMMQRQRLVTVNQAQLLRKVLPIIGIFTLIAGKAAGMDGALAALAGGMAGLSQGLDQKMQDAWKQYTASYNQMMARVKETQAQIKAVIDDRDKTQMQKVDLLKALGSQVAAYRLAIDRSQANDERMQIAQLQASTRASDTAAHDAVMLAIANMHSDVERQSKTVEQQKKLADVALKPPTTGDMKTALGALFGPPDAKVVKAATLAAGDPLLGGGKVDPYAGYDVMQQAEARQLLSQTNVYIAQHPEVPRDVALQRVQAGLFQQGLSQVASLRLPQARGGAPSSGKTIPMAKVREYVASHPGKSQDEVIADLKAKGYGVVP